MNTQSIGSIVCTPSTAMPGQSVLVDVHAPDGTSYHNQETFFIGINGIPGSYQYLQFIRPGTHTIYVTANGPGGFEQETTTINVQQPTPAISASTSVALPPPPVNVWPDIGLPILQVGRMPHASYQVAFSAGAMIEPNGGL